MASSLFHGTICVQNNREAVRYAGWAADYPSTEKYIHLNLFCDASKAGRANAGGAAVIHRPWLPVDGAGAASPEPVVEAAWPINPLHDIRLGEFIALAECLFIAVQEIQAAKSSPLVAGKLVFVRIFNDNLWNIEFLKGTRALDIGLVTLAAPLLRQIRILSHTLNALGVKVRLELHWIPGHDHKIAPHILADEKAVEARHRRRSNSTKFNCNWDRAEEGTILRMLKAELHQAA